jgi:hypothetical protein
MKYSTQIIDEGDLGQPHEARTSIDAVTDRHFKQFITSVSEHVAGEIGGWTAAAETSADKAEVSLTFVRRPLLRADDAPVLPASTLFPPNIDGERRLDSPWVKIAISPPPHCAVHAVVIWSERQFLLDQALMSGARARSDESVVPIAADVFGRFVADYTDSVLHAPSLEARSIGLLNVAERIPPDVLWLLRHAWQSTRGPFSGFVASALIRTIERGSSGYASLSNALVDRAVASASDEERYTSVLELKDVFTLEQYQIDQLQ